MGTLSSKHQMPVVKILIYKDQNKFQRLNLRNCCFISESKTRLTRSELHHLGNPNLLYLFHTVYVRVQVYDFCVFGLDFLLFAPKVVQCLQDINKPPMQLGLDNATSLEFDTVIFGGLKAANVWRCDRTELEKSWESNSKNLEGRPQKRWTLSA